jgi:outer membrane protein TolC
MDRTSASRFSRWVGIGLLLILVGLASWPVRAENPPVAPVPPPAPGVHEVLPIDLTTALRLVDEANPTVAVARARYQEALARLDQANLLWIPDLQTGPSYLRHDGNIQNAAGFVFQTSKTNLFEGGGLALRLDTREGLFLPLIARRLAQAEAAALRATSHNVQLDVALAYLDLARAHAALVVNADLLLKAEYVARATRDAVEVGLARTTADRPRAATELNLRRLERLDLENDAAVASARLARLLLLRPTVDLRPADPALLPVVLVKTEGTLDDLVATGLMNRPELAEGRAFVAAALARWRQARVGPFLPRLEVTYFAGTFGGGLDSRLGDFAGRGDGTAQAIWELRNLGAGDVARARERRAQYNGATSRFVELEAMVAEEVTTAAKQARVRELQLAPAQEAVFQAEDTWKKLVDVQFNVGGRDQARVDAIQPVLAIQALAQARARYLNAITDFNKSQFRLYAAMGQPPLEALPCGSALPLEVSPLPAPGGGLPGKESEKKSERGIK